MAKWSPTELRKTQNQFFLPERSHKEFQTRQQGTTTAPQWDKSEGKRFIYFEPFGGTGVVILLILG